MDLVIIILKIISILVLAQFIVGPILIFKLQKMPETIKFKLLESDDFLLQRTTTFTVLHEKIISNKFEYIGSSEIIQSNSNMYFSIYNNFESKLACTLSTISSGEQETTQIEFSQMYNDGSIVNVNNNPIFEIYPSNNKKLCFRFPDVNDFEELLNIAMKLHSYSKTDSNKITYPKGKEFSTIESFLTDEQNLLVNIGWVLPEAINNERQLTAKGAMLMAWKLCWPIKLWFNRRDISKSRKALENA